MLMNTLIVSQVKSPSASTPFFASWSISSDSTTSSAERKSDILPRATTTSDKLESAVGKKDNGARITLKSCNDEKITGTLRSFPVAAYMIWKCVNVLICVVFMKDEHARRMRSTPGQV
jgi:hypothetical protein